MANDSFRIKKSLNIEPKSSPTLNAEGDIGMNSTSHKLELRDNAATRSVVTEDGTATLTNKTFDADGTGNSITNIENADIKAAAAIALDKLAATTASRALVSDASGFVSAATTTATEIGYVNGVTSAIQTQLNTKITASSSDTLTNKSIDADANTITNIENADIKAGAAIERTKIANGTANHVVINDGSGTLSSEASLSVTRGGTGTSTQFTQGSIPFAGASGVFSQNNANLFWDNTNGRLGLGTNTPSSPFENAAASALSRPAKRVTGSWITGGTGTTTTPHFLIQPTGTAAATGWSTGGTALGVNSPAGYAGSLFDFRANGTSRLRLDASGALEAVSVYATQLFASIFGTAGFNSTITFQNRNFSSAVNGINMMTGTMSQTSGTVNQVAILPTYNQVTSTASNTDFLINRTETSIGSGTQRLIDAQVGGSSKFSVDRLGNVTGNSFIGTATGNTTYTPNNNGVVVSSATNAMNVIAPGAAGLVLKSQGSGSLPIWGPAASGINYLSGNPDAETDTTGWATYADASGTSPVNGTDGSPTVTWTRSTSSPLRGTGSFLLTKDANNRQGEGASFDFTIDSADQAKALSIDFDYIVGSGTFVAGNPTDRTSSGDSDLTVWIYDVTNAVVIQPSNYRLYSNSSTTPSSFYGQFQTASNSTSYRLIIHCGSTSTSAFTMKFDNFSIAPSKYAYGTPITDWQSFTPTGSWSTNTTYTGYWRRVGDTMEIVTRLALAGAPTSADLTINIPSGYTIDTAKTTTNNTGAIYGDVDIEDSGSRIYTGNVIGASTTSVYITHSESGNFGIVNATNPVTFGNADTVTARFSVPITGWSSSVQMSDSADTRVVAASYSTLSSTSYTSPNAIVYTTKLYDSHSAYNTSTGQYTIPVPGVYRITVGASYNSAADFNWNIYKNGSSFITSFAQSAAGKRVNGSQSFQANAGDVITVVGGSTDNFSATDGYFSIEKISGPSAIAATETIALRATRASTQTLSNATYATIIYSTISKDTHGAYNNSTGIYTVPSYGFYSVKAQATLTTTNTFNGTTETFGLELVKVSGTTVLSRFYIYPGSGNASYYNKLTDTVELNAGDQIFIRAYQDSGGALDINGNAIDNVLSIFRIK